MINRIIRRILLAVASKIFPIFIETQKTAAPVSITGLMAYKLFPSRRGIYWPIHFTSVVTSPENIKIGIGTAPGLSPGCYIQGVGRIFIGDYTIVAPNVGLISANHQTHDLTLHSNKMIQIGSYCWIGMNSVVLPGVCLGDFTIVGAGSIVTKSFPKGYCVIAGNPAKKIKDLEPHLCTLNKNEFEYYGFIQKDKFHDFRKTSLKV